MAYLTIVGGKGLNIIFVLFQRYLLTNHYAYYKYKYFEILILVLLNLIFIWSVACNLCVRIITSSRGSILKTYEFTSSGARKILLFTSRTFSIASSFKTLKSLDFYCH
jgi:hypothetical protein